MAVGAPPGGGAHNRWTLQRPRQAEAGAAVSDEVMAFQHGFMRRGPERISTSIVDDLVIVRGFGVLTPAEKQLADSHEGRGPIRAIRQQVLEAARPVLENVSVHSDISTRSGEWMDIFVLDHGLEEEHR